MTGVPLDEPVPADPPFAVALLDHLRPRLDLGAAAELLRFPGGRANLTYLVRDGDREVVVRRPPYGELPPRAHDMVREHRALSALAPLLPFVPRPLLLCEDPAVIGAQFLVMERRRGHVLRDEWPAAGGGADVRRRLSVSFTQVVVRLHGVDPAAPGLAALGRPQGFVDRQIRGWAQRWRDVGEPSADADAVFAWLAAQPVPEQAPAVVHNDLKLENVLLDAADLSRIVALFDWDMCTVGDPLVDVGTLLAYWAEPGDDPALYGGRLPPTALPGFASRAELVAAYAEATGRDLRDLRVYRVLGLVRVAVLCQQLLRRDPRLEVYRTQVPALLRLAAGQGPGAGLHPVGVG